jgi:hypothetical protein
MSPPYEKGDSSAIIAIATRHNANEGSTLHPTDDPVALLKGFCADDSSWLPSLPSTPRPIPIVSFPVSTKCPIPIEL